MRDRPWRPPWPPHRVGRGARAFGQVMVQLSGLPHVGILYFGRSMKAVYVFRVSSIFNAMKCRETQLPGTNLNIISSSLFLKIFNNLRIYKIRNLESPCVSGFFV